MNSHFLRFSYSFTLIFFTFLLSGQDQSHQTRYVVQVGNDTMIIDQTKEISGPIPNSFVVILHEVRSADKSMLKSEFLRELDNVTAKRSVKYSIQGEFKNLMSGYILNIEESALREIEKQSKLIKKIYTNHKVKAFDVISNNIIGAPVAWNAPYNLKGTGVKIAIIDTGVELNHHIFGGKTITGYDFINNDNDPSDDHGHGTHCAGIAAANSDSLKGVAPEATIIAVKVLNQYGSGDAATIALGIDYAVDPDGNPATNDGADILSISLGALTRVDGGIMDDAVEMANEKGVLSVIAAGNDGWQGYYTIANPGTAPSALTVGASQNGDNLAWFSSKGPTFGNSFLKPELVAPGVDILSGALGGTLTKLSGTSMATPHVAGAAAIIKQMNPLYRPDEVKNILQNNTKNLTGNNTNIFDIGKGLLNIRNCLESKSIISPSMLNLGQVPENQDSLKLDKWVKIKNINSSPIVYKFELESSTYNPAIYVNSGLQINITDSIQIGGNQTDSVLISIRAKISDINFITTGVNHTYDNIKIMYDTNKVDVPIVLLDEFYFYLKVNKPKDVFNFSVIKSKEGPQIYAFGVDSFYTIKSVKADTIVVGSIFGYPFFHIKDKQFIKNKDTVTIDFSEIKNKISFTTLDSKRDSLFTLPGQFSFLYHKSYNLKAISGLIYFFDPNIPIYSHEEFLSNISDGWEYHTSFIGLNQLNSQNTFYNAPFVIDNLNKDSSIITNPCKYILLEKYIPSFNDFKQLGKNYFTLGVGGGIYDLDELLIDHKTYKEYQYPVKNFEYPSIGNIGDFQQLLFIDSLGESKRRIYFPLIMDTYFRTFLNYRYNRNSSINQIPLDKTIWQNHTLKRPIYSFNTSFFDKSNQNIDIRNYFMYNDIAYDQSLKIIINKYDGLNNLTESRVYKSQGEYFGNINYNSTQDKVLEFVIQDSINSILPNKLRYSIIDTFNLICTNSGLDFMYCKDSSGVMTFNLLKGKNYELVIGNNFQTPKVEIKNQNQLSWIELLNPVVDLYFSTTFEMPTNLDTGTYEVRVTMNNGFGISEFTTVAFSVHNSLKDFCSKKVLNSKNNGEGSLREAIYCIEPEEEITFMQNIDEIILVEDLDIDKNMVLKHNEALKPLKLKLRNNAKVNVKNNAKVTFKNIIVERCDCPVE
jgi:hypothetical protein